VKNGYFRQPFAFCSVYNENKRIQNSETGYRNKVHPVTNHKGPEGVYRYSSILLFNLGAWWGGWSKPGPSRFAPSTRILIKAYLCPSVYYERSHSCGAPITTAVSVRPFVWGIQKFDNCSTDFREIQYYTFSWKDCLSTLVLVKILQNSMRFVSIITFLQLFQSTPIKSYRSENVSNNSFKEQ
jgi:hypothetical protein